MLDGPLAKRMEALNSRFVSAVPNDLEGLKNLLRTCLLPYEDVDLHRMDFILAKRGSATIGVVGMERFGAMGLLRSFAVDPTYRRKGVSNALMSLVLSLARERGVRRAFLMTTTIEKTCAKNGFRVIGRSELPDEIRGTAEFRGLCPKTAICMVRDLERRSPGPDTLDRVVSESSNGFDPS